MALVGTELVKITAVSAIGNPASVDEQTTTGAIAGLAVVGPLASIQFSGSSSGSTILQASAVASGTLTLPAATDTLIGKATTDTLTNKTLVAPVLGVATGTSLAATGLITSSSPSAGIGYATGAGGTVTQATDRSTGVTLSKISGTIVTNNASLAAETSATFTATNTTVAIGDVVVVSQQSGSNGGNTNVYVSTTAAGSFAITVANNNPVAGTAETGAIIINFAVIKAVSA